MRIISGKFGGRVLEEPKSAETRPTMDRVKQSFFDSIGFEIENSLCLDLFAGSGSLGIEALSRGASNCIFVDKSIQACAVVKANLSKLGLQCEVLCKTFLDALKTFSKNQIKFDFIFLDPPYKTDYGIASIKFILENNLVGENGAIIFETDQNLDDQIAKFNLNVKKFKYGSKFVFILKK